MWPVVCIPLCIGECALAGELFITVRFPEIIYLVRLFSGDGTVSRSSYILAVEHREFCGIECSRFHDDSLGPCFLFVHEFSVSIANKSSIFILKSPVPSRYAAWLETGRNSIWSS